MIIADDIDTDYSYSLHMSGAASTLPPEEPDDIIKRLHDVVAEVTGKAVEKPARPRMGFL